MEGAVVTEPLYRPDLARIHVAGFGFHWSGAAEAVLGWLRERGIDSGTVVDLGCGGGEWLGRLTEEGYDAVGIDASPEMIRMARKRAPRARLVAGSFADVELPPCDAVTSLGEPLNYLPGQRELRRTIRRVARALRPGGVFVFDVRHPPSRPVGPREGARSGDGWFCHHAVEEDGVKGTIERRITTFTEGSRGRWRRDFEIHRLKVFPQAVVAAWLRDAGFVVSVRKGYGEYRLRRRQSVFLCRRRS